MSIPIFLLAAFGLIVTWKSHRKALLAVYILIALTIAQNLAFYANIRFRAPIEPLLVLLVGGVFWWLTRLRWSKQRLLQICTGRLLHCPDPCELPMPTDAVCAIIRKAEKYLLSS